MESPFMTSRPRWSRRRSAARLFLGAVAGLGLTATPAVALDASSVQPTVYASAELTGPSISLTASPGPGGTVTFSGTVTDDESVDGCLVVIEGPGIFATAIVSGNSFSTSVSGIFGESPITVTATVTDADGNTDEASDTFTPSSSIGEGTRPKSGNGPPPPPPPPGGP
jgi:hypothetical protein